MWVWNLADVETTTEERKREKGYEIPTLYIHPLLPCLRSIVSPPFVPRLGPCRKHTPKGGADQPRHTGEKLTSYIPPYHSTLADVAKCVLHLSESFFVNLFCPSNFCQPAYSSTRSFVRRPGPSTHLELLAQPIHKSPFFFLPSAVEPAVKGTAHYLALLSPKGGES